MANECLFSRQEVHFIRGAGDEIKAIFTIMQALPPPFFFKFQPPSAALNSSSSCSSSLRVSVPVGGL